MPGVNIQAPSLKPPRVSILSSADIISIPGDRWWGGIHYKQLSGDPSIGAPFLGAEFESGDTFILPICPVETTEKATWPRGEEGTADPFAVYATESCSAWGVDPDEQISRARQKLAVNEAWTVEHEMWFGTATTNLSFQEDAIDLGTGEHPLVGFSRIDAQIAHTRADGRGMVYMSPYVFDLLQQYTLFRREGNVWFSPLDNVVVPMRGAVSSETGFDNGAIFGHPGQLQIVRSEVFTFPENAEELQRAMDRKTNDLWVVAERVYSYIIPSVIYGIGIDTDLIPGSGGGGGGGDASASNQLDIIEAIQDNTTELSPLDTIDSALNPTISLEEVTADTTIAGAASLRGWSVWNTSAGVAEVTIHAGNDSGDAVVARFRLAEDESVTEVFPVPVPTAGGIHFEVVSGTVAGTVYYQA